MISLGLSFVTVVLLFASGGNQVSLSHRLCQHLVGDKSRKIRLKRQKEQFFGENGAKSHEA